MLRILSVLVFAGIILVTAPTFADSPTPITIINSGSTNSGGYKIDVQPNGATTYTVGDTTAKNAVLPPDLTQRLFANVQGAGPLTAIPVGHCAKSVSFGTTTTVTYNGQRSPDVSCPSNPQTSAIFGNVQEVHKALGINYIIPRHRMTIQRLPPVQLAPVQGSQ